MKRPLAFFFSNLSSFSFYSSFLLIFLFLLLPHFLFNSFKSYAGAGEIPLNQLPKSYPDHLSLLTPSGFYQYPVKEKDFKSLKVVNHHPFYKNEGESLFEGIDTQSIYNFLTNKGLSTLDENSPVILIDKSGSYSIEISLKEFLAGNIIAFKKNNHFIPEDQSGVQMIYSAQAFKKHPHLSERYYWCWWVTTIIFGSYNPIIASKEILPKSTLAKIINSQLNFPAPYGISSLRADGQKKSLKVFPLKTNVGEKLQISFIHNKEEKELIIKEGFEYFIVSWKDQPFSFRDGGPAVIEVKKVNPIERDKNKDKDKDEDKDKDKDKGKNIEEYKEEYYVSQYLPYPLKISISKNNESLKKSIIIPKIETKYATQN